MSADGNDTDDGNGSIRGGGREVAYRVFAGEYDDATRSHSESDEERAPNYVITPTGARVNRVFAVGTLTEVSRVNDEMLRARVVDPTGAFVVYAGQYQPDELAFLERAEPPLFVAVTGKARTFEPDDSDRVYTSIRPESLATVDAATRDRWVVSTAEATVDRVETYAAAAEPDAAGEALTDALREAGVDEGLATGIPIAQGHYGTTPAYLADLRALALDAVRVVAGERDEVEGLSIGPDETGGRRSDATFAALAEGADLGLEADATTDREGEVEPATAADAATGAGTETRSQATADGAATGTATAATAATADDGDEAGDPVEADSDAEPESTETEVTAAASGTADEAGGDERAGSDDAVDAETAVDNGDLGTADDDLEDFEPGDLGDGMYEMDDEEREELEAEFGAEFTTGAEVDEPGGADVDVSAGDDEAAASEAESGAEPASASDAEPETEPATDAETEAAAEPETDTETAVVSEADERDPEADDTTTDSTDEAAAEPADTDDSEAGTDDENADAGDADAAEAEDVDLQEYAVETMEDLDDGSGADREAVVETVADETGAAPDDVEDAIQDALMGGQCYEPDDETLKAI